MIYPICLIIPPSGFLLDARVFMPLGVLRVAAVLEERRIPVEVLDLSGVSNYLDVVLDYLRTTKACIFGFTATTPQLPSAVAIAKIIHGVKSNARLILGGPHATLVHAAHRRSNKTKSASTCRSRKALSEIEQYFDVIIAGDGEDAIFEAIKDEAPKIINADDPNIVGGLFLKEERLNSLPFPARDLVDTHSYRYTIDGEKTLSIIAQLGCPFPCGFCGGRFSPMLRRVRTRSSENIVHELLHLYREYGVKGFMFYDDELNVNTKIVELMELITKTQRDLHTTWKLRGFVKSELFTDEQAEVMYKAGFRWILTGFESGSSRILKNINKKATQEKNTRCVEIAHRHGLKVKALMSIGHPGESLDTIRETEDWLLKVRPDDFDVTIITVYPGTPYYDEAELFNKESGIWVYTYAKSGDRLYQQEIDYTETADYYKGSPDGGYCAYVWTDHISSEMLVKQRDLMERVVRKELDIPFNPSSPAQFYEHSMGQNNLPTSILRASL